LGACRHRCNTSETGQLIGFAKVTPDITERQQAHNEILESERHYRRLVEAVVDYAIFQLDASGHVATWNPGAQRIKVMRPQKSSASISAPFTRLKI
jgi:PAS domain-containing protein